MEWEHVSRKNQLARYALCGDDKHFSGEAERRGCAYTHVRAELEVACATLDVLVMGVVEMTVDDLFRQGKGPLKPFSRGGGEIQMVVNGIWGSTYLSRTMARLSSMRW